MDSNTWRDQNDSTEWIDPGTGADPLVPDTSDDGLLVPATVDVQPTFSMDFDLDTQSSWKDNEWVGAPIDEAVVSKEEASKMVADIFIEKYYAGAMFATDICKISWWLKKAGIEGGVADLAKPPGLHTSHYNRHMKNVLGLNDREGTLDTIRMPSSSAIDGSRVMFPLPVLHPHEVLNKEIADHPELKETLAGMVRGNKFPLLVTDHKVIKASGGKAQPTVLYIDGVPTTKHDGVLGFLMYFCISKRRHLVCVVRKARICKCGCRGRCSLFVIFSWLNWSMRAMAKGTYPSTDWMGKGFEDPVRKALGDFDLLYSAGNVAYKGDWMEYCSAYGFAN